MAVSCRMVVRRLSDKMPLFNEGPGRELPPWRWTATKLGALLHTTGNNIQKIDSRLPKAGKRRCPECRGDMWVLDENGTVEEHGNGFHETCVMSGRFADPVVRLLPMPPLLNLHGLARTRPDLYRWAVSA